MTDLSTVVASDLPMFILSAITVSGANVRAWNTTHRYAIVEFPHTSIDSVFEIPLPSLLFLALIGRESIQLSVYFGVYINLMGSTYPIRWSSSIVHFGRPLVCF